MSNGLLGIGQVADFAREAAQTRTEQQKSEEEKENRPFEVMDGSAAQEHADVCTGRRESVLTHMHDIVRCAVC